MSSGTLIRKTLSSPHSFSGIGLHTGRECEVKLAPRYGDTSGWFINGIPLNTCPILNGRLATTIDVNGLHLQTPEHLFAALLGLGITDLDIQTESTEVPILDGSSRIWFEALAPVPRLGETIEPLRVSEKKTFTVGDATLSIEPSFQFYAEIKVSFEGYGTETFSGGISSFKEAMTARTFGYVEDLDMLKENRLARGANATNVLGLSRTGRVVGGQRAKEANELARHKWLDLLGDVALIGQPIVGLITSTSGGHRINHMLVNYLRKLAL